MKGFIIRLTGLIVLIAAALSVPLGFAPVASAADFAVNSTADEVDANPNDGTCLTANGDCTLRAAIQQANASGGSDTILVPAGTYTLTLAGGGDANGDLDIQDGLTITGDGAAATIIDGGGLDRVFEVHSFVTANISGVTITNGLGGLYITDGFVTLAGVTITGNTAGNGAGVYANGAQLTISGSTISNNAASLDGAGLSVSNATLTVSDTTISGNTGPIMGGGMYLGSGIVPVLTNVTVSGNSANHGGGIYADADVQAYNVTITGNDASQDGDGLWGVASLFKTVIAGNGGENCYSPGNNIMSFGFNLADDATCSLTDATDLVVGDAQLGPLADNGGATRTHALLPGSPAIDAGPANAAECPAADQRGVGRPVDGDGDANAVCDIGAYEAPYVAPPPPTPTQPSGGNEPPNGGGGVEPPGAGEEPTPSASPTPVVSENVPGSGSSSGGGGWLPGLLIGLLAGLGVAGTAAAGFWFFVVLPRRRREEEGEGGLAVE